MTVIISTADLTPLKAHLLRLAPQLKASHRAEAMARGLGFGRYASLLAALEQGPTACRVDDAAFLAFLTLRDGDGLPPTTLTEAVALAKSDRAWKALATVVAHHPDLSANGFRTYDSRVTARENAARFEASRAAMLTAPYLSQFERALAYLETRPRSKGVSRQRTSYGHKHDAERFHRKADPEADPYVANGLFLAAALHLGFLVKRDGLSPNGFLNIAVPPRRRERQLAGDLRGPVKKAAWRNMMVAAINAGLDQNQFGLTANDNRWDGEHAVYRFSFDGLPAIAGVRDIGFGELSVHVAVQPTDQAEDHIDAYNAGLTAGDAFASGYMERERGAWLQVPSGARTGRIRPELLERIASHRPTPNGFADTGKLMT